MTVAISSALHARLRALAAASPDAEICGLLFGAGDRIAAIAPAANVAAAPADSFEIDPAALVRALKAERAGGPRLVGHYHSHPNGAAAPSPRDAAAAAGDGRLWLILAAGEVRAWRFERAAFVEVALAIDG